MFEHISQVFWDALEGSGGDPDAAAGTSETTSEDWQNRFKGLQRKFNELQSRYTALENDLNGARAANTNLQQRITALEGERSSDAARYEGQLSELRAKVADAEGKLTEKETELGTLRGQVETAEKDKNVRRILSQPQFQSLLPFYEAGMIDGLRDMTPEQITERLNTFSQMIGQQRMDAFQNLMQGALPPADGAGTVSGEGMNYDQLEKWLANPINFNSPQYDQMRERFHTLVKQSS